MLADLMAPLTGPFVGRLRELELLERALGALEDGEGDALSVVGAAGIGKSRLLAELAERSDARGHLVLTGAASELEGDLPFGVFVDAIDSYVETVDSRRVERLDEDVRTELSRVFPSLAAFGGDAAPGLQDERHRAHRAVRVLLETLAGRPLLLILDDLHWADPASVELVGALLRRPPAARVLIVLGFRPHQLPGRLGSELTRARRAGALTQLDLEPLSLAEARELLGEAVPAGEAAGLFEESGGGPLFPGPTP